MPDQIQSYKVICNGGLNSNENHLDLSDNNPGAATRLVNYEVSLFGGYRRINGFQKFGSALLFQNIPFTLAMESLKAKLIPIF